MRAAEVLRRIRVRHGLGEDEPLGIRAKRNKIAEMNEANRCVRVIATTDDVDLSDEVVLPAGAAPSSYFFTNKSVFLDHHYQTDRMVGKMRAYSPLMVQGAQRGWMIDIQIISTPLGLDTWTIIREAGIGTSIGFIPTERTDPNDAEKRAYPGCEKIIRQWNWLEQSLTAFPCNVRCQQQGFTETDDSKGLELLDELVTKGAIRPESAYVMGLPEPKAQLPKLIVRRRLIVE